jgi:hypothetical protein
MMKLRLKDKLKDRQGMSIILFLCLIGFVAVIGTILYPRLSGDELEKTEASHTDSIASNREYIQEAIASVEDQPDGIYLYQIGSKKLEKSSRSMYKAIVSQRVNKYGVYLVIAVEKTEGDIRTCPYLLGNEVKGDTLG